MKLEDLINDCNASMASYLQNDMTGNIDKIGLAWCTLHDVAHNVWPDMDTDRKVDFVRDVSIGGALLMQTFIYWTGFNLDGRLDLDNNITNRKQMAKMLEMLKMWENINAIIRHDNNNDDEL